MVFFLWLWPADSAPARIILRQHFFPVFWGWQYATFWVHYSIVAGCGVWQAFLLVSLPYLIKDVLSVAGALAAALILRKTMSRAGITIL